MSHRNVNENGCDLERLGLNSESEWGGYPLPGQQGDVEDALQEGFFASKDFQIDLMDRHLHLSGDSISMKTISLNQRIVTTPTPDGGKKLSIALAMVTRNPLAESATDCCVVPYDISVASGEAVKEMRRIKNNVPGASESTFSKYAAQVDKYAKRNVLLLLQKKFLLFVDEGEGNDCQLVVVLNPSLNNRSREEGDRVCGFGVFCSKTPPNRTPILRPNSGLTFLLNVLNGGLSDGGSKSNSTGTFGNVFAQNGRKQLLQLVYYNKEDLINPAACKTGNSWCALLLVGLDFILCQWRREYRYRKNQCELSEKSPYVRCNAKYFQLGLLCSIALEDAKRTTLSREQFERLMIKRVCGIFYRVLDNLTELAVTRQIEPFHSYPDFDVILKTIKKDYKQYNDTKALPKLFLDGLVSVSVTELEKSLKKYKTVSKCFPSKSAPDIRNKKATVPPVDLDNQVEKSPVVESTAAKEPHVAGDDTNLVRTLAQSRPLELPASTEPRAAGDNSNIVRTDATTLPVDNNVQAESTRLADAEIDVTNKHHPSGEDTGVIGTDASSGLVEQAKNTESITPTAANQGSSSEDNANEVLTEEIESISEEVLHSGAAVVEHNIEAVHDDNDDDNDDSETEFAGDVQDTVVNLEMEPIAVTDTMARWGTTLPEIPDADEEYTSKVEFYIRTKLVDPVYMSQFGLEPGLLLFERLISTARRELEEQLRGDLSTRERFRLETECERHIRRIEKSKKEVYAFIEHEYHSCYRATYLSLKYENGQWFALSVHKSSDGQPIYTDHRVHKRWITANFAPGVAEAVKADAANGDYFTLPESKRYTESFDGRGQIVKIKFVPAETCKEEYDAVRTNGKRFRRSLLSTVTKPEHFLASNAEGKEWKLTYDEAKEHFESTFLDAVVHRQSKRRKFVAIPLGDVKDRFAPPAFIGPIVAYNQGNRPVCLWASLSSALAYYPDLREIAGHTFTVGTASDCGDNQWSLFLQLCCQHLSDRFQLMGIPSGANVLHISKRYHPHDITVCALFDTSGSRGHAIAITSNFIFDGNERNALELSQDNLDRCVSTSLNKYVCINITHGYVLYSPGRIVRSALHNIAKALLFRGQRDISELFEARAQAWPLAKCPSSLKLQGKHLNIINIIAGLFQKEPFKYRKITKNEEDVVRDPFDLNGNCKRRKEDILLMELHDGQCNSVEAIVSVGSTWFGDGFSIGRPFEYHNLSSYITGRELADEFHGVIRCTVITTPGKHGDTESLRFLNANYDQW